MHLAAMVADSVGKYEDKPALFFRDQVLTYRELWEHAGQVKNHLLQREGIAPGDRVALWMGNCPEFIILLIGILRSGAVAVPLNHFLTPPEADGILKDAQATVVFSDADRIEARSSMPHWGSATSWWDKKLALELSPPKIQAKHANDADYSAQADDLAVLIYTSGTTGQPKGAMLSHENLLHNTASCAATMETTPEDRVAVVLPLFHSFMLTVGVLLPLQSGGSIVLLESLHPAKQVIQEISRHQATILPAIPPLYRALASMQLPSLSLRLCISGAAPLPVEILNRFNRISPAPIIESYGLSEASPVVTLNPIHGPTKAGSIGIPIKEVEVAIMDTEGNPLPDGEVGELRVRGKNVMKGYWQRPQATRSTLQDGWLRTGDMGHRDADGFLFVTDRQKDMLLVNGINVYPREIEEHLYQCEGVKEASVIGTTDSRKGEQPVAFVVMEEGYAAESLALTTYLKPRLAAYKIPRQFHFVDQLPRTATGKVKKTLLREQLASVSE